jgi:aerobic-type carbon monoxide dehydrogenase small subunit (CoxS/CutS family)
MPQVTWITVNGSANGVDDAADRTLLSVLRDDLRLTGTKYGCGEGECGACTVLIDGVATRSCRIKVGTVASPRKVTTIEDLEKGGHLHPLQQAFIDHGAMQCAYCTSGMLMSGVALLRKNPNPSTAEIIKGMNGNICRCGTYQRIIAAIQDAAKVIREGGK